MRFPLARFQDFAQQVRIPSKEAGSVPLDMIGTQRYFIEEVSRGLEDGVHFFVTLKGRQQGFTTIHCCLDLFWTLDFPDTQGLVVTDSDENHAYFRDVNNEMLSTLPDGFRLPVEVNNDDMLRFGRNAKGHGGSRLMYQIAGQSRRKRAKLGRGRGVNYLHGDELGYWQDQKSIGGLVSSLARENPRRFYSLGGTANGFDVLWEMWRDAERQVTRRRIFVGWWRNEHYRVEQGTPLFDAYGVSDPTEDEWLWIRAIKKQYDFSISPEQLAWYRALLAEEFAHNEDMRGQEHPCLPEDAFVSFGDKFIRAHTIRRMRSQLAADPSPIGLAFQWADYFDQVKVLDVDPRDLAGAKRRGHLVTIWEQPINGGVYLLGAAPPGDGADDGAITVWRLYPDVMRQVAEYTSLGDTTYQFTWALVHLAGAYSVTGEGLSARNFDAYVALETAGIGQNVLREMSLLKDLGWGLSTGVRHRQDIKDLVGSFREYLFRRPDSFSKLFTRQWKGTPQWRAMLMHTVRDLVERGVLQPRSETLIAGLASVRRGDDSDDATEPAIVIAAAIGARHYQDTALHDVESLVAPARQREEPEHVGQILVQNFMYRALRG